METGQAREVSRGYRPWLDGVRAIAVLLVLLHHSGVGGGGLGAVGVAIFFALSGYLITGLLLDEHSRSGAVALGSFYVRRLARLVPALLAMVVVSDILFCLAGQPVYVWFSLPGLLYGGNYATVMYGDYLPAFGHTWSLAVEEHFYLVWPLLLLFVLRRFPLRRALGLTLAACALVMVWRLGLVLFTTSPALLIAVGSVERADALLYGAAAAIAIRLGWRPQRWMLVASTAAITAVALVRVEAVGDSGWWLVSISAVMGVGSTAVIARLDCADGVLRRALSTRPLVAIGLRSYGIYLWHGPVKLIAVAFGVDYNATVLPGVVSCIVVAWVSYRWVEVPIRNWARSRQLRQGAVPAVAAATLATAAS